MSDETLRARALFREQIECVTGDDRARQAALYADDFVCEFPYAIDRPRRIEGKEAFLSVMRPFWERSRASSAKFVGYREEIVETGDPDFIVAEFTFVIELAGRTVDVPFVQFLRSRGGKTISVREYFSPTARQEALGER